MDKIDRLLAERGQLADLVDGEFQNKATGQSPFAADQAAAQRAQLVQRKEAGEASPEPVRVTTVWDRIGGIFGKKKEDARAAYLRLLRKVEVDGGTLKDAEVILLAESMQVSGITETMAASHRATIKKLRAAEFATQQIQENTTRRVSIEREIEELRKRAEPLKREEARLMAAYSDVMFEVNVWRSAAAELDGMRQRVAAIFGEAI